MHDHRIPGAAIIGMNDLFVGAAVGPAKGPVVVVKPSAKPTASTGPTKRPTVIVKPKPPAKGKAAAAPRNQTVSIHKKALAKGRATANRAAKAALAAGRAAKNTPKVVTKVGADLYLDGVYIGGAPKKPLTPKQKAAVQKAQAAVKKSAGAAPAARKAGLDARKKATELAKKVVAQKAVSASLRGKGKTAARVGEAILGGDVALGALLGALQEEFFTDYYTAIGALPDPNNPGFLDDGSPDPAAYTDPGAAGDPLADMGTGTDSPLDSPAELPPAPSMDTPIADLMTMGGLLYNNEQGTPDGYAGSYAFFHHTNDNRVRPDTPGIDGVNHAGYVWGRADSKDYPTGVPYGNQFTPNTWNFIHGRGSAGAGWRNWDDVHGTNWARSPSEGEGHNPCSFTEALTSNAKGYGPLIGNPAFPNFKGMRVDSKGKMGWLPQDNPPDYITFPLKQAAALTLKAEQEAAAAAAKAEQTAAAKIAADQAAAQAAQDAANALAESAAASEQKIAEQRQATEAKQAEMDQAKAAADQQRADQEAARQEQQFAMEQARSDAEAMRQEQQFMMEQARADAQMQQQYMQQQMQMEQQYAQAELQQMSQMPPPAPGDYAEEGYEAEAEGEYGAGPQQQVPQGYADEQGGGEYYEEDPGSYGDE